MQHLDTMPPTRQPLLDMYVDTLSTLVSLFSLPLTPCVVRVGDRSPTSFAAGQQVDILPCKAWIESHVVYVGAYPIVPACFGHVDEVMITLVDLFEFELEVSKFVIGEIAFVLQSML